MVLFNSLDFESVEVKKCQELDRPFGELMERVIEWKGDPPALGCSRGVFVGMKEALPKAIEICNEQWQKMSQKCGEVGWWNCNEVGWRNDLELIQVELVHCGKAQSLMSLSAGHCRSREVRMFLFDRVVSILEVRAILSESRLQPRVNTEMFEEMKSGSSGIDVSTLRYLHELLVESLASRLNQLATAIRQRNCEDVRSHSHYLKSSYGVIGLERLSWLMNQLEIAAKTRVFHKMEAFYRVSYPELWMSLKEFQTHLSP